MNSPTFVKNASKRVRLGDAFWSPLAVCYLRNAGGAAVPPCFLRLTEERLWSVRRNVLLTPTTLAVLIACGLALVPFERPEVNAQTSQKHNIVFVLTDNDARTYEVFNADWQALYTPKIAHHYLSRAGEEEIYDLDLDPYELGDMLKDGESGAFPFREAMQQMQDCQGAECSR